MNVIFPKSKSFFSDLILQRTEGFIKCGGRDALNRWFNGGIKNNLIDYLLKNNKYEEFIKITMSNYLREVNQCLNIFKISSANFIVSIGPGNGIFEMLLLKKIKNTKILLIDIEATKSQKHGFNQQGSGYASLLKTKNFLINNGISSESIQICNPVKDNLPIFNYDLLISLYSMGFHYPCNQYVDFIIDNASVNSKIIYDKRRYVLDTGHEKLLNKFNCLEKIQEVKHDRICIQRT